MSEFPASFADALYARWVLREARRGKSPRVAPGLPDADLLREVIRLAWESDLVRSARVQHYPAGLVLGWHGRCRLCGCSDADCRGCVEVIGRPCSWVAREICSACAPMELTPKGVAELGSLERVIRYGCKLDAPPGKAEHASYSHGFGEFGHAIRHPDQPGRKGREGPAPLEEARGDTRAERGRRSPSHEEET